MYALVLTAIWLMLPAYLPNTAAALIKGKTQIDFGKNFLDGRRIFGDGKTYRGFLGGALCGFVLGLVQNASAGSLGFPYFPVDVLVYMSAGAMLGDLIKSFFKRRVKIERGRPFPLMDQLDFVFGAWLLTYLFARPWFSSNFTLPVIITVLVITPLLHLGMNAAGYKLGKKDVWW